MAETKHTDRPTNAKAAGGAAPKEQIEGPVPMHHRLRLGQTDGQHNVFGADEPKTGNASGRPGY